MSFKALTLLIFLALPVTALAWGERGHHVICAVATDLVQDANLKAFLRERRHTLGHLCNIPDISWRNLGDKGKAGDATHFIDPEAFGFKIEDVPLDFETLFSKVPAERHGELFSKLGSLWWRADQFFNLAVEQGKKAKSAPLPVGAEIQNWHAPYNEAVYSMLVNMGVMGHFFGDASMPYHSTEDYDGYKRNHGGIHSYYETLVVNEYGASLDKEVLDAARMNRDFKSLKGTSTLELIRRVSVLSSSERQQIEKLDKVLKPSIEHPADGQKKIAASRVPPSQMSSKFKKLINTELGRAALALAKSWDQIYVQSGRPDLTAYRSFQYPLMPDFVAPEYTSYTPTKK